MSSVRYLYIRIMVHRISVFLMRTIFYYVETTHLHITLQYSVIRININLFYLLFLELLKIQNNKLFRLFYTYRIVVIDKLFKKINY